MARLLCSASVPPLRVGQLAEAGMDQAQMRLQLGHVLEHQIEPEIAADLRQGGVGDERPDIVDDQPGHGRVLAGRQHHADQAAHRGADPVDTAQAQQIEEAGEVGGVDRHLVPAGVGQPAAAAAAGHVDRDHTAAPRGQAPRPARRSRGRCGSARARTPRSAARRARPSRDRRARGRRSRGRAKGTSAAWGRGPLQAGPPRLLADRG